LGSSMFGTICFRRLDGSAGKINRGGRAAMHVEGVAPDSLTAESSLGRVESLEYLRAAWHKRIG
jgi:hypothetical protein